MVSLLFTLICFLPLGNIEKRERSIMSIFNNVPCRFLSCSLRVVFALSPYSRLGLNKSKEWLEPMDFWFVQRKSLASISDNFQPLLFFLRLKFAARFMWSKLLARRIVVGPQNPKWIPFAQKVGCGAGTAPLRVVGPRE